MRCGVYALKKSTNNHRQCNSPVKPGEKGEHATGFKVSQETSFGFCKSNR